MKLILKKSNKRPRVLDGHPWVFQNELESPPTPEMDGAILPLVTHSGRSLGKGFVSATSLIAWRQIEMDGDQEESESLKTLLERSIARREDDSCRRLVAAESDFIPGLIVDQYNDVLVVRSSLQAIDMRINEITAFLQTALEPREIIIRSDSHTRTQEGLKPLRKSLSGNDLKPFWVNVYGVDLQVDLLSDKPLPDFLVCRQEMFKLATFATNWRALDLFSGSGGMGLHCAMAGADEAICVDSDPSAISSIQAHSDKNNLSLKVEQANAFEFLSDHSEERFDLIIMDPPSFCRSRKYRAKAFKAHGELHRKAVSLLNSGGILASYCRSNHVTKEEFRNSVEEGIFQSKRVGHILYEPAQPLDFPLRANFSEGETFFGVVARVE